MPRTKLTLLLLATAASGCGTGGGAVKPDAMSAAQHREEAARENEAARQHAKDYDPQATVASPFRSAAVAAPSPGDAPPPSVYMFGGGGAGWAVGIVPLHTLGLTLGGIVERAAVESGQLVTRELLDLTVSVDHDVVDGAPAARFVRGLREAIEMREGVDLMSGSSEPAVAGA